MRFPYGVLPTNLISTKLQFYKTKLLESVTQTKWNSRTNSSYTNLKVVKLNKFYQYGVGKIMYNLNHKQHPYNLNQGSQLVDHRSLCGGQQSYLKNWLLGSKMAYFSYIYWRIDKNRGLRCADLFFGDQGKNRPLKGEDFLFDIRAITGQTTPTRHWRFFFQDGEPQLRSNSGGPQSNGPCKLSRSTEWASVPKRLRTTDLNPVAQPRGEGGL